jgi:hypothetical protein
MQTRNRVIGGRVGEAMYARQVCQNNAILARTPQINPFFSHTLVSIAARKCCSRKLTSLLREDFL